MTKRIFRAIMLVAGIILLASLLIIMDCLYEYFASLQESELKDQLSLAAAGVEQGGEEYLARVKSERYRLTWIAPDGTVKYDSGSDKSTLDNHAAREEVRQALEAGEGQSTRYSATLMQKTMYYAKRLDDGSVIRISVSRATIATLALGMLRPVVIIVLAALVLAIVMANRLAQRIVAPLNALDLDHPLDNDAYEEIAPLLSRINRQHTQIDAQMRALDKKKDEFNAITRSMNEGLVLLDEKGSIISINPAARQLFNAEENCAGRDFITVNRNPKLSEAIRAAYDGGHGETTIDRGGKVYQLDVSRIESNGKTIGAVILTFDITEKQNADAMRREFTANVSHELKTPLQGIIGSAELIENGMVKAEDMPRFADVWPEDYLEDFILQGYYRKYDISELYGFTQEEVALIRNGQFAMSGERFKKRANRDYFGSKSWYNPFTDDAEYYLNDNQRENASLCKKYERQMGWLK